MDFINWIIEHPTIITALGTIAVAIATIYYAYTNHKLWLHMEKGTMRPNKLDEICFIIKPFIEHCNEEILYFKKEGVPWDTFKNKTYLDKFSYHESVEIVYSNFIKGRPFLKKDLECHDNFVEKFSERYKELVNEIESCGFHNFINQSFNEFEKTKESQKRHKLNFENLPNMIMSHILDKTDIENNQLSEVFKTYWKRYGKNFLKMKDSKKAKEIQNSIKIIEEQLLQIIEEIKKELEIIFKDYINEYGISLEDIESKDMPKDERKKYIWET